MFKCLRSDKRGLYQLMSGVRYQPFFLCLMVFLGLVLTAFAASETEKKDKENPEPQSIVIKSKTMEMNNALKMATFMGDVNATRDDFVITCDTMQVFYERMPALNGRQESKPKLNRIIATGNVSINRSDGVQATAEEARYYQEDEKMVLTGDPSMKRGDDLVKGDRITIFLKEERSVVEGSEEQKVSVTISPRHE